MMRIGLAPLFMSLLQKDGCSGLLRALISGGVGFWERAQPTSEKDINR